MGTNARVESESGELKAERWPARAGRGAQEPGGLLLERSQKLIGVFIAGHRGGANGTKRGHDLRLDGTLSVRQNTPGI